MSNILAFLKTLVVAIIAVLAPIQSVLVTTLVLIITDFTCGIWAAYKRNEEITSAGFRRTVTKILAYEVALVMAFITETYILQGSVPLVRVLSALVCLAEFKSIVENISSITGTDLIRVLIDKIGSDNFTNIDKK